jgi:succinoglycan biosynthesis transport protein ExoP
MLQIDKLAMKHADDGGGYDAPPLAVSSTPADLLAIGIGFIRRQFPLVLSVALLTIGLAVTYLFITPPLYSAHARMIINTGKVQVLQRSVLLEDPVNSTLVDSQIEILKSENFALSIIKKLRLTEDPEFVEPSGALIRVARKVDSMLFGLKKRERSEYELTQRAVDAFEQKLTVSRVGYSYAIDIMFQSLDPDRAAQIANAVADAFIVDQLEARYQAIREATAWLQER